MLALLHFGTVPGSNWSNADIAWAVVIGVLAASWLACAFFTARVASAKGYDGETWGFLGLLFGVMALVAAAGLPVAAAAVDKELGPRKPCPDCANRCPIEARICGQCRFEFVRAETLQLLVGELRTADKERARRVADRLRSSWDMGFIDVLVQAAQGAEWGQVMNIVRLLIDGGACDRLQGVVTRMLGENALPEAAKEVARAIARTHTATAAKLLLPMLGRYPEASEWLVVIGPEALPALDQVAVSSDKKLAKESARVIVAIKKEQRRKG
jgi:hypothetical protein